MKNLQTQPKKLPLILILIGTTILAIPAALGTLALIEPSGMGPHVGEFSGQILFCISIGGFFLFGGYILTAVLRSHSRIFWFLSMLYNLGLSAIYWYLIFLGFSAAPLDFLKNVQSDFEFLLVPIWTVFVTSASAYYCFFPFFKKKTKYL